MIKIENTEAVGFEAAIRGMRNPLNSWDKSDSIFEDKCLEDLEVKLFIGDNDLDLMKRLSNAGTDHSKYLRMIVVYADLTAPLYFWKEFDTYKVGTVRNSCSTMHKIHSKEFEVDDFSIDNFELPSSEAECIGDVISTYLGLLEDARIRFNETKDKQWWKLLIQLLPSSYNQRSTVMMNYQVLKNMYHSRKNHKLDEWHDLCHWIELLPYSELITGSRKADPMDDDLK